MTSLSTDAEDLTAGAQRWPELDAGDSVTARLALACFAAVRRIAPDVDREPIAVAQRPGSGRDSSRPRDCERRCGRDRPVRARR